MLKSTMRNMNDVLIDCVFGREREALFRLFIIQIGVRRESMLAIEESLKSTRHCDNSDQRLAMEEYIFVRSLL